MLGPSPSTLRRHRLCDFIDSAGKIMVQKCKTCAKHDRVCKVHIRSGKCSECLRRGQRCDVKVTESEFRRLAAEKKKLQGRLMESRKAQDDALKLQREAMLLQEKALENLRVARLREERLRQQLDLLGRESDEAVSVEMRALEELGELEPSEVMSFPDSSDGPSLGLSPATWGAFEGWPFEARETFDAADAAPDIPIPDSSSGAP
ncbi:hypothetical protein M011DRAFT_491208 [Sporormia fimetaria CBS 119925]|uniref:Zn(2)-C6 fungal-type domain-containing protein n=1 Tax=Sporormia fimetaria CBS 119925 TaxID=1340428 RepID=A0A6A6UVW9_9PLEO|nr:hypothetical protein M011DRAFT_491208 [Sporormia fimetaria CBS 119925]